MNWILIFLKDLRADLQYVIPVLLVLGIVSLVGVIFFRVLVENKKITVIIPGGAVLGTAIFILYLGIFSYVFKGIDGIWVIFLLFVLSGLYFYSRNKNLFKLEIPKLSIKNFALGILALAFVFVIFVKSGNAMWGGDAITYWGFSTSFSNGNYPMVLPWQPQFLTVHHQGAFLFEGAAHALTRVDIRVVHFIFAAFIIAGGFFLFWAYVADKTKKPFLSLIAPILGYMALGGFFIPILKNLYIYSPRLAIELLPTLHDAKNALGALTSFFDLYYLIPRTVDIAIIIIVFLIIVEKFRGSILQRLLLVSSLSVVVLSVDESMFSALILPIAGWVLYIFIKSKSRKGLIKEILISGAIFAILFWVVGNPIRDSILTPSSVAQRFQIVGIDKIVSQNRVGFLSSYSVVSDKTPMLIWYLPDFSILLVGSILISLTLGGALPLLLSLVALGSTILYFFVDHTFWPGNYARFLLTSYQFIGFSVGVAIVYLLVAKSKVGKILGVILFLVILPGAFTNIFGVVKSLPDSSYTNFTPLTTRYEVLDWISTNLSYNSRVFFLDGFLYDAPYSDLTLQAIQGYGLFVPISSATYKMHTAEYGVEAIDVITSLSPKALKKLNIEYVYVKENQIKNYSSERQKDLVNPDFFIPVYKDNKGVLYGLTDKYLNTGREMDDTIEALANIIPENTNIYVDSIPGINYYVRSAAFLALKDKGNIYSVWGPGHYNYVETFITIKDSSLAKKYDYLLLGPKTDVRLVCKCSGVKKIWRNNNAVAFKVIKQ